MIFLIIVILSYLIGAIPFSFILAKIFKNTDLRKVGSGNIGATNLSRIAGFKIGLIGLFLDIAKGIIPVVFLVDFIHNPHLSLDSIRLIIGFASICGHNWTIFLKFKGGKGVATSLGVLIALAIKNFLFAKIILILSLVWFTTFFCWGYVSLSSIISAAFLPLFLWLFNFNTDTLIFGIILACFVLLRHKSNIYRLFRHKESRFDLKSKISSLKKKALS